MSTLIKPEREMDNPLDTVSQIYWDKYDSSFRRIFVASWDGFARLYYIEGNSSKVLKKKWEFYFNHPVLTMDNTHNGFVIAGLANGQIGCVDMQTGSAAILGNHEAPICKVVWVQEFETILTFGFDYVLKVFSLQNTNGNFQLNYFKLPSKTNTVAYSHPYILIGTQDAKVAILNIRFMNKIDFKSYYQSVLEEGQYGLVKFSCCSILPIRNRIAFGTVDGRLISMSYADSQSGIKINRSISTYKIDKKNSYSKREILGQINTIELGLKDGKYEFVIFSSTYYAGVFNLYKGMKTKQYSIDSCVSAIGLNPYTDYFAYCIGNDWCKGMEEIKNMTIPPKIVVTRLSLTDITYVGYGR